MRGRYTCIYYFIKDCCLPLEFYMWNRQRKKHNREEASDLSIYLPRSPAHRLGSQRQVFPITCYEWRGSNSLMPRWPFQHLTTCAQQFTRRSWFPIGTQHGASAPGRNTYHGVWRVEKQEQGPRLPVHVCGHMRSDPAPPTTPRVSQVAQRP